MRDEIIKMAREAGFHTHHNPDLYDCMVASDKAIERFFHMAQAAEREACMALHDHEDVLAPVGNSAWGEAYQEGWGQGTAAYRDAIRARGQA